MAEAFSCGGIVTFRKKILLLYKNYRHHYDGWVLPKGTMEEGESREDTALREVAEETGASAKILGYIDESHYQFQANGNTIDKTVYWFLMEAESYYSKPQKAEFFQDAGYYKYHEAYHLLKFQNEREILEKGFALLKNLRSI